MQPQLLIRYAARIFATAAGCLRKGDDLHALLFAGTASFAVHWMLIEMGVPFDAVLTDIEAGAQRDPEYLRLNPAGGCRRW